MYCIQYSHAIIFQILHIHISVIATIFCNIMIRMKTLIWNFHVDMRARAHRIAILPCTNLQFTNLCVQNKIV